MDTLGLIIGILSAVVGFTALFVSVNIYNATGEYHKIKRYRLKNALKYYLRRSPNLNSKTNQKTNGYLHFLGIVRVWVLSYYLLIFSFRITPFVEKQQKREIKRRDKNKSYSSVLAEYGLGGVISFARNYENDYFETYVYKTVCKYLEKEKYTALISFVKLNFSATSSKVENQVVTNLIEKICGYINNQNKLAGVLLYLHWYRIHILGKAFPSPGVSNIESIHEEFNKKDFYDYFKEEYEENIYKAYFVKDDFGGALYLGNTNDDKAINFLMLVKYMYFYSNHGVGREMREYINAMIDNPQNNKSIIEYSEKTYKEQLELVGGKMEMTPSIINFIGSYRN